MLFWLVLSICAGFVAGVSATILVRKEVVLPKGETVIAGRLVALIPRGTKCSECGLTYAQDDRRWRIDLRKGLRHDCDDDGIAVSLFEPGM